MYVCVCMHMCVCVCVCVCVCLCVGVCFGVAYRMSQCHVASQWLTKQYTLVWYVTHTCRVTCLSVRSSVFRFGCLPVCLFIYLFVSLPVCLPTGVCLFVSLFLLPFYTQGMLKHLINLENDSTDLVHSITLLMLFLVTWWLVLCM